MCLRPTDEEFCKKIGDILVERENYQRALEVVIIQEETASLILQHFQTLICRVAGVAEAELTKAWNKLVPDTQNALFKHENT